MEPFKDSIYLYFYVFIFYVFDWTSGFHLTMCRNGLTHWGRATHICVGILTSIGSDNGLSPGRRQTIIWTNAVILCIEPLGTNFSESLIRIKAISFKKMILKMSSAKWRLFRLGLNELNNGLAPNRIRAITWPKFDPVIWRICASPNPIVLNSNASGGNVCPWT